MGWSLYGGFCVVTTMQMRSCTDSPLLGGDRMGHTGYWRRIFFVVVEVVNTSVVNGFRSVTGKLVVVEEIVVEVGLIGSEKEVFDIIKVNLRKLPLTLVHFPHISESFATNIVFVFNSVKS